MANFLAVVPRAVNSPAVQEAASADLADALRAKNAKLIAKPILKLAKVLGRLTADSLRHHRQQAEEVVRQLAEADLVDAQHQKHA